jgi:hypothetical protein
MRAAMRRFVPFPAAFPVCFHEAPDGKKPTRIPLLTAPDPDIVSMRSDKPDHIQKAGLLIPTPAFFC